MEDSTYYNQNRKKEDLNHASKDKNGNHVKQKSGCLESRGRKASENRRNVQSGGNSDDHEEYRIKLCPGDPPNKKSEMKKDMEKEQEKQGADFNKEEFISKAIDNAGLS